MIRLAALAVLLAGPGCQKPNTADLRAARPETDRSLERLKERNVLQWGADVVGGIPYVYEDPGNPGTYIGFEMDIARAIGRELGVETQLVIKAWDTLIPELQNGSFDMAMNGIEDTEDRSQIVRFSDPYYVYSQQITVRRETEGVASLEDLRGKTVATLSGTAAEDILRATEGINTATNPEIIYSYRDLELGRVDAVLLDTPIAAAYGSTNPKLKNVGRPFGDGRYVVAFREEDHALREAVNQALDRLKTSGELRRIYQRWGIMNEYQERIGVH